MSETYQLLLSHVVEHLDELPSDVLEELVKQAQAELASRSSVNACTRLNNLKMRNPCISAIEYIFHSIRGGTRCTLLIIVRDEPLTFTGDALHIDYPSKTKKASKLFVSEKALKHENIKALL